MAAAADASAAVAEGVSLTGRVITAAAAIMVCVFLSFVLGDQRTLKEFGFALAVAVLLDALVVRCMLLPALAGADRPGHLAPAGLARRRLPHIAIEGSLLAGAEPSPGAASEEEERGPPSRQTPDALDVRGGAGSPVRPKPDPRRLR